MSTQRAIRDCKVCVVGGAGFLGSHLVNHLIEDRGCEVMVVDNLVSGRRKFIHKDATFEHHDITGSEEYLKGMFCAYAPRFVFNYAAFPYVPFSYQRPLLVFNVNAFGAMKVIHAAQESGKVEAILQVSSAEVYGEGYSGPSVDNQGNPDGAISESDPVAPHSSYGMSKAAIDAFCQVRWKEQRTPVIALRQFNCIGERETHPYIVPEIISQLNAFVISDGKRSMLGSDIAQVYLGNNSFRDFLYAGDAVKIAVELLERGQFGEVYNLGSEAGVKMYDLAKLIGKLMGFADVQVQQDQTRVRPWEIWHLQSDNSKIRGLWGKGDDMPLAIGGWCKDTYSLEFALKRTIAYYEQSGRKWCWE